MEPSHAIVLPQIRCVHCGKILGHLYEPFLKFLDEGKTPEEAYRLLGLKRYCCRMSIINPPVLPAMYNIEIETQEGKKYITESTISDEFQKITAQTMEIEKRIEKRPQLPYEPEPAPPPEMRNKFRTYKAR